MSNNDEGLNDGILAATEAARTLAPGVHLLPAQGNALAIETSSGVVVVDAGPGGRGTARMIEALRGFTDLPVRALVYSHGHVGYNAGVPQWLEHAAERGDAAPALIAQAQVPARYRRYAETYGLQLLLHTMQFNRARLSAMERAMVTTDPTITFTDRLRLDDDECPIEVLSAPSETDDTIVVWLPNQRIVYGGASTPGASLPNIGTPLRTLRLTVRWAETMEMISALAPVMLVQEFGPVIEGESEVRSMADTVAAALRWMRAQVVDCMNRGMIADEIVSALDYPDELFEQPYMAESYGAREYIVRDIFREENGWWVSRNPTDLHPAHPDNAAGAIASVVDPERVLARARELADSGETQLAMHVIDLIALAPGDDPTTVSARELKAELCEVLAKHTEPYVSRGLYRSSAMLLRSGHTRWSQAPGGVHSLTDR